MQIVLQLSHRGQWFMYQASGIASRYLDNKQWLFNQNVLFHVLVSCETDKDSKIHLLWRTNFTLSSIEQ